MKGNEELCRFLIEAGSDMNKSDETGRTIMHYAAMKENPKLIEYLYKCYKTIKTTENSNNNNNASGSEVKKIEEIQKMPENTNPNPVQNEEIPLGKSLVDILSEMNEIDIIYQNVAVF